MIYFLTQHNVGHASDLQILSAYNIWQFFLMSILLEMTETAYMYCPMELFERTVIPQKNAYGFGMDEKSDQSLFFLTTPAWID